TQGDCNTLHALALDLDAGDGEIVKFPFIAHASVKLRRKDGAPVASLRVKDGYSATRLATFASSCRMALTVRWNEPDVDSALEAEGRLARLE
ncbi:hypothetical protein, partial [Enterococcus casseliflavus]|uniref:hypothetical protein n=1 Tax=Enterococcus casseliflavus TaxID=37734 RepID=UPI003D0F34F9